MSPEQAEQTLILLNQLQQNQIDLLEINNLIMSGAFGVMFLIVGVIIGSVFLSYLRG